MLESGVVPRANIAALGCCVLVTQGERSDSRDNTCNIFTSPRYSLDTHIGISVCRRLQAVWLRQAYSLLCCLVTIRVASLAPCCI